MALHSKKLKTQCRSFRLIDQLICAILCPEVATLIPTHTTDDGAWLAPSWPESVMSIYDLKSNPNNESRRRGPSPTYEFHMPAMPPLNLLHSARRLLRASSQRRRLRRLLELDDHMLEDMGYCRYELRWALRLPLKADAFTALQRCRAGRE